MNITRASGLLRKLISRAGLAAASVLPGGKINAFGSGFNKISSIIVINLDRQPGRWHRVKREIGRFRTPDGTSLTSIIQRFAAIDARDGRAVAATADVDPNYRIGDQLFVQPDPRLSEHFSTDEPVIMTRQEVAVARSHIEVWKIISAGPHEHVLVLEDDIWFKRGAAASIDRGWQAALKRCPGEGPKLLYLSYADAGGTVERADVCDELFRPVRGLWFLSGYVLSKVGAAAILKAMPVIGPVDMWINYHFERLGALALSTPAILQRADTVSDNAYSILPHLARAGIVDAGSGEMSPVRTRGGPLIAWSSGGEREGLAMALSMLGLRVRVFDEDDEQFDQVYLQRLFETFDALIDPPLTAAAVEKVAADDKILLVCEAESSDAEGGKSKVLPTRAVILTDSIVAAKPWRPLCALLGIAEPSDAFPMGAQRKLRLFRDDRADLSQSAAALGEEPTLIDVSPWILPPEAGWLPRVPVTRSRPRVGRRTLHAPMCAESLDVGSVAETFPGNLAVFAHESITYDDRGAHIRISEKASETRLYQSGAFSSKRTFCHGHVEAEIRAARGGGLITGFFLYRDRPRQEIDIELLGGNPRRMMVNVYFNPGDDGSSLGFGYRGTPCYIDLGFDSTSDYHKYAIDWNSNRITWSVDGVIVHERVGWDPTPIPHLPLRLHVNLWASKSAEIAGQVSKADLPALASVRNISVSQAPPHEVAHSPKRQCGRSAHRIAGAATS